MSAPAIVQTAAPDDVRKLVRRIRERRSDLVKAARQFPACFAKFVLKDERTGGPITLAPMHKAWHQLATDHQRLLVWSSVESGKTSQIAIARTLFHLGYDSTTRACILSNTHKQAAKIVGAISQYIEQSPELKEVWPNLVPDEPWTSSSITIKRPTVSKDPSLQATGVGGNILGARLDFVVVDDILDFENTLTETAREKLWQWFNATIMGRLTKFARVIVIGNAHHPEDLMHKFARNPGWKAVRYPVIDDTTGHPRWPERWSAQRIAEARSTMLPVEFARQLLCVARDEASSRFKREWIDKGLQRGDGKQMAYGLQTVPPGCKVFTGVDLAVQQHSAADLTCLFTIVVHPNGDREVLQVESGRWAGPDIVSRIYDTHRRYQSTIICENNSSQDFIVQFAAHRHALPIKGFTTGRNKAHPEFGVEQMATEMYQGKWIIPNEGGKCHPEIEAWIQEMLFYDPRAHTGDRVMASWFAKEGHRMTIVKAEVGRVSLGPLL